MHLRKQLFVGAQPSEKQKQNTANKQQTQTKQQLWNVSVRRQGNQC